MNVYAVNSRIFIFNNRRQLIIKDYCSNESNFYLQITIAGRSDLLFTVGLEITSYIYCIDRYVRQIWWAETKFCSGVFNGRRTPTGIQYILEQNIRFQCLMKFHATIACEEVEVELHASLNSTLGGDELWASRLRHS
jgi:hypothetical protein